MIIDQSLPKTENCSMILFKALFIFLLCLITMATAGNQKAYKCERTGKCKEGVYNATIDFSGIGAINERLGFKLTGAVNVTRDIKKVLCMQTTLQKCAGPDLKCEKFGEKLNTDVCPALLDNLYVGDLFTKIFVPGFTCPIRKGQYLAAKSIVDLSRVDFLPFDDAKVITTLEFFERDGKSVQEDKRRPLGCWFLEMTRTTVRKRG